MFKIGDRVKCIKAYDGKNTLGELGKVIGTNYGNYGVEFDDYIDGHSCSINGNGKNGHCWNFPMKGNYLELVNEEVKMETKFAVGQKYIVGGEYSNEYGNTIEITHVNAVAAQYKTVVNVQGSCYDDYTSRFDLNSSFRRNLTPVKKTVSTVVITTDGKTTTATLRNGKTVLNKATSVCCPTDEFSAYEGARIALARLFGEEAFSVPVESDYTEMPTVETTRERLTVGDRVSYSGDTGTIIYDDKSPCPYLVEFDKERPAYHNGQGRGKEHRCYWLHEYDVTKSSAPKPEENIQMATAYGTTKTETDEKFKIGDRVTHLCAEYGEGTIIGVESQSSIVVEFDKSMDKFHNAGGMGKDLHCWWTSAGRLTKVKPEYTEVDRKAKVGDLVKIVDAKPHHGGYKNGDIFTVEGMRNTDGVINSPYWVANGEYVVLVPNTKVDLPYTNCKIVKQDKYAVGDKVRIVSKWVSGCSQNRDGEMDKYLGTTMTITRINGDIYYMVEDQYDRDFSGGWPWRAACIEGKVTARDLVVETPVETKIDKSVKIGDVVRIIAETDSRFKLGELYVVKDIGKYDPTKVFVSHPEGSRLNDGLAALFSSEYEVVRNISVKYRAVDRPAKVGDKIMIENAWLPDGYENGDVFTVKVVNSKSGVYVKEHNCCIAVREYAVLEEI